WDEAQAAAVARGGYLATILSDAENTFVFNLVNDPAYWRDDLPFGPWIGGYQPPGSPEPAGGWTWVNVGLH
ncbi:MAG: C-type lectin domain-containing protein, partial [Acidobacteriota bacterium]